MIFWRYRTLYSVRGQISHFFICAEWLTRHFSFPLSCTGYGPRNPCPACYLRCIDKGREDWRGRSLSGAPQLFWGRRGAKIGSQAHVKGCCPYYPGKLANDSSFTQQYTLTLLLYDYAAAGKLFVCTSLLRTHCLPGLPSILLPVLWISRNPISCPETVLKSWRDRPCGYLDCVLRPLGHLPGIGSPSTYPVSLLTWHLQEHTGSSMSRSHFWRSAVRPKC